VSVRDIISPRAPRLAWLRSGLFWRTFLLLGLLTALSMVSWVSMIQAVQHATKVQQQAELVVSVVSITKTALINSAPELRTELLLQLVSNEGIQIFTLEDTNLVDPPPDNALMADIENAVKEKLGKDTLFASRVDGRAGFWVSFNIDEDKYWLMLERDRFEGLTGVQWLGWASVVGVLSMLGAAIISSLINLPLARLAEAAHVIAQGKRPEPLPEKGPKEVREANRSFNQMVDDLQRVESDRAVILAGISHDLRTPLARMQLELEMAKLSTEAREGLQSDIAQMDAIIGQFLDYAKPTEAATFVPVDIAELLHEVAREAGRIPSARITTDIAPDVHVMGNAIDLRRVFNNLIENAHRYGRTPEQAIVEIDICCQVRTRGQGKSAVIALQDHGAGVPPEMIEQLLKPFTRLDSARGQANGAGLGLAIVQRVVTRHNAELNVSNREGGGLRIELVMPLADQ